MDNKLDIWIYRLQAHPDLSNNKKLNFILEESLYSKANKTNEHNLSIDGFSSCEFFGI